jgi:hypothetical protein
MPMLSAEDPNVPGAEMSDPTVHARKCDREEVMLAGSALAPTRSRTIIVCDLSPDGARLAGRDLPPTGDEVLIKVGSSDMLATVAWQTADHAGVAFEEPLSDETIAAMKREGAWESATGWWR